MKATSQTFDSGKHAWNNYQDAPRGKLRYRMAEANPECYRYLEALELETTNAYGS